MSAAVECNVSTGDVTTITSGCFVLPSLEIMSRLRSREQMSRQRWGFAFISWESEALTGSSLSPVSARILSHYSSWRQIHKTHEQKVVYRGCCHSGSILKIQYWAIRYVSEMATKFWHIGLGAWKFELEHSAGETSVTCLALTYRNWRLLLSVKTSGDGVRGQYLRPAMTL